MTSLPVTQAKDRLSELLDQAAVSHEAVQITGEHSSGFLVSEADWLGIQETLYLVSIPGMRESIQAGLAEPLDQCADTPGW